MTSSFLRALNPLAAPADIDPAKTGGAAGLILAALAAWGALALYLGRNEFLSRYAAGLPAGADPAVTATAQGMGPTVLAMAIGFQLVFAAVLALAAWMQFRRGGWLPLVLFAAVTVYDLWTLTSALLGGVPSGDALWLAVRFVLALTVLVLTAASLRASLHRRRQSRAP